MSFALCTLRSALLPGNCRPRSESRPSNWRPRSEFPPCNSAPPRPISSYVSWIGTRRWVASGNELRARKQGLLRSQEAEEGAEASPLSRLRGLLLGSRKAAVETSELTTMMDLFDLEKQFSFYGAYHSNKVNIVIHFLFVWPIFFTSMILWAYTQPLVPLPLAGGTLPLQQYMVLNWSFVQAAVYALYYVALDKKAGSLAALLCFECWMAGNAVAQALPWSVSWKIVLASQVICWTAQIYGHQKFEGRSPALLDNLPQAFLMAPFFVLLEGLQSIFGYEPYPGFRKSVEKNIDDAISKFRAVQGKRAT